MIADLDNDGEIAWTDFELFIEVIRAFNHLYMAVYVKLEQICFFALPAHPSLDRCNKLQTI